MKKIIFACILSLCCIQLFAQKKDKKEKDEGIIGVDVVYLKDGSFLKGELLQQTADTIRLNLIGNHIIDLPSKLIKRKRPGDESRLYFNNGKSIKISGRYTQIRFGSSYGRPDRWGSTFSGAHLGISHGKFINDKIAIGVSTGLDIYDGPGWNTYTFIPLVAEIRGFPFRKKISPYYSLGIGAGIAADVFGNQGNGEKFSSGLLIQPSIGLMLASKKNRNLSFEMGYKIQQTKSEYLQWNWNWGGWNSEPIEPSLVKDKLTMNRFHLSMGFTF